MDFQVIVLAAGQGKRMGTKLPKIMHTVGGVSLLERAVNTARELNPSAIHVVYGNGGDTVKEAFAHLPVDWVLQAEQLGTGHAVLQAMPQAQTTDRILVLYGDVPLISAETLKKLITETPVNAIGVLVAEVKDPTGLGRIIRDTSGCLSAIVEEKDATTAERAVKEINTGIMILPRLFLQENLPALKNQNKQEEYYLTDLIALAVKSGHEVKGIFATSEQEIQGVNDLWQLAALEDEYQLQRVKALSLQGIRFMDPKRVSIRAELEIASDVVIDVNVVLKGRIKIGAHAYVGPNVILENVEIGEYAFIDANTVIKDSVIESHCQVGPFAHLRPGTHLKAESKVGNFVEMKKTILGEKSKANHLSYLGDSLIGAHVNIGAGTITCNYDGVNKHQTVIGDEAFIGSNASLVAPVVIGEKATIGAGSVITSDAPANHLTVARVKQKTIDSWQRPCKKVTNKD